LGFEPARPPRRLACASPAAAAPSRGMLDRYARHIRRRTLLDLRGAGEPFLGRETAKPIAVAGLAALVPYWLGASPRTILLIFAVPALLCLGWWAFILRHWWIVFHRYSDRSYHLVTKKMLSREYREQRSPYDGRSKRP
jgi:hypothetical protein